MAIITKPPMKPTVPKCYHCGKAREEMAPFWPKGVGNICADCVQFYAACEDCGAAVSAADIHFIGGKFVCPSCCNKDADTYFYHKATWHHNRILWMARKLPNLNADLRKGLKACPRCKIVSVHNMACHDCGHNFFNCHKCKKLSDYDTALRIPPKTSANHEVWECHDCSKDYARCGVCSGALTDEGKKWMDLKYGRGVVQACHACVVNYGGKCKFCDLYHDRNYVKTIYYLEGVYRNEFQEDVPRSAKAYSCDACTKLGKAVHCAACARMVEGPLKFIRENGLGPKGCAVCCYNFDACTFCDNGIKVKNRVSCANCQPIGAYNDRAPEKTGFLGTPEFHKKNCQVKGRDHIDPNTLRIFHAKGCNFDSLYLGVELEVEARTGDAAQHAMTTKKLMENKVITKRDGSLRNGFEIVTGPGTLDWHHSAWQPFFAWQAVENSLDSQKTTTCGLHVHVSRAPLSWLQIAKMLQFMYDPDNYDFLTFMAGRLANHYADLFAPRRIRADVRNAKWENLQSKEAVCIKSSRNDAPYSVRRDRTNRYSALNLVNTETIEFRIFKGTLNQQTFFARVEFCHALVKYAAPSVCSLSGMTAPHFVTWVRAHSKDYPALIEYLGAGGYIEQKPPKNAKAQPAGRTV